VKQLEGMLVLMERSVDAVRHSTALQATLHAILELGNEMNRGKSKGNAHGFKVSCLMSIVATKGSDALKTTLLDFLVESMVREGHPAVHEMATSLAALTDRAVKTPIEQITATSQKLQNTMQRIQMEHAACKASSEVFPGCHEFGRSLSQFLDHYAKYFQADIVSRCSEITVEAQALLEFYAADDMKLEDFFTLIRSFRDAFQLAVNKSSSSMNKTPKKQEVRT